MKHILVLLLLATPTLAQRPAVGECVRDAHGNLVYASVPAYTFRSEHEKKAFFFLFMNRKPQQADPQLLAALNALQANQSRMIELIAVLSANMNRPAPAPTYPPEFFRQQAPAPQIIIVYPEGSRPRQELSPERAPRQNLEPESRPRQDLQPEKSPRQPLSPEKEPKQPLAPEKSPRQDLLPDSGKPRQDFDKAPLPPGVTSDPPKGYQSYSVKPYTKAIWTRAR